MINTVLFDLDSTLADDGPNWRNSVSQTLTQICTQYKDLDQDLLQKAYYEVAGSVWDEICLVEAAPWGNMDDPNIVRRVWTESLARFDVDSRKIIDRAVENYLSLRCGPVSAYDDAVACLEALAPLYRLGIITNGASAQQIPKLESAGLASYFEVVITTDCGYGKPNPSIFAHTLSVLNTLSETSVYVGDSLTWDVNGANRAGLTSIWLNRRSVDRKADSPIPDIEIKSLSQLPSAIKDRI